MYLRWQVQWSKGVFMRVKGKRRRRVVVMLEGIMGISVEVHPDLIEVIS